MADNTSNLYKFDKGSNIFFYSANTFILLLLAFIVLYPLYFIIIASISDPDAVLAGKVFLYPVNITFAGFSKILEKSDVWRGYLNSIIGEYERLKSLNSKRHKDALNVFIKKLTDCMTNYHVSLADRLMEFREMKDFDSAPMYQNQIISE